MSIKALILKIFQSKKFPIIILFLNAIILLSILFISGPVIHMDTKSYLTAMNNFFDVFRTPVYPLLLSFNKYLFGSNFLYFLVIIQILFYLISSIYFKKTLRILNYNTLESNFIFSLYTILPFVNSLSLYISTESISISLFIFFIYYIAKFLKNQKKIDLIGIYFLAIILIFTRPSFVVLIPIILLINFILFKKMVFNTRILSFCMLILCCLSIFLYTSKIKEQVGIRTISTLSIINKGYILTAGSLYDLRQKDSITQFIKNCQVDPDCDDILVKKFGYVQSNNFYDNYYFTPKFFRNRLIEILKLSFTEKYLTIVLPDVLDKPYLWPLFRWIGVPFIVFYIVIFSNIYTLLFLGKTVTLHSDFTLITTIYCIMLFLSAVIYGGASYGRICVSSYPLFYIFIANIINRVLNKFKISFFKSIK